MKRFYEYLKYKKGIISLFILFYIVYCVIFVLNHLPIIALVYPGVICFVIGVFYLFVQYYFVQKSIHDVEMMKNNFVEVEERFPDSYTVLEKEYQELIVQYAEYLNEIKNIEISKQKERLDYYTMWVHQMKTPIASMKLQLQNMDSNEARMLLNELVRIEQYVNMVLTYLRLEEGNDLVIQTLDINEIVRNVIKRNAGEFILRKLKLKYEPCHLEVLTDEKWISFVVEQILSNALKYTKEGSIHIYCKQHSLIIEDTGIGIDSQDLPRIFEKGYTGFNGRLDKKASGIGLYLCKRICDRLGHSIQVESQLDAGTKVSIDFSIQKIGIE